MATLYWFWDASRAVFVLLALASMGLYLKYRPQLPREHRLYSWPIFAFVGTVILSWLANATPEGGANVITSRYFLLLFAVPLVSLFYLGYDARRNHWMMFAAGCVVMGGLALYDILWLGEVRAGGGHNSASFGFAALAMVAVTLGSYHRFSQMRFGRPVFFLAILLGLCAMVLSGTRSSWIAGAVVFFIALFVYLDRFSILRQALFSLGVILVLATIGATVPVVENRIDKMVDNFTPYLEGKRQKKFNSLRYRVEAWKFGWQAGLENKAFGFGPGNTKRAMQAYAEENRRAKGVGRLNHIHSQFMQSFAMTGVFGLAALVVMFACHFWIFIRYMDKRYSPEVRFLALSGLLLLVAYLLKSIPGVPFYGKQYLMIYGLSTAVLWGSILGALRVSTATSPQSSENRGG